MLLNSDIAKLLPVGTPIRFSDATYARPTKRWLEEDFWKWFTSWRFEMGLSNWTRRNDCDNFARAYAQAAQDCHALSVARRGEGEAEGLAVGEFHYYSQRLHGWHAIVIAVVETGLIFVEPQNNRQLVLTESELRSCVFCYF